MKGKVSMYGLLQVRSLMVGLNGGRDGGDGFSDSCGDGEDNSGSSNAKFYYLIAMEMVYGGVIANVISGGDGVIISVASHGGNVVPILVKIILKISDRATEYAVGALLSLCSASELTQREALAAGLLTKLLLLVQSDCTERAKRKAQMLLKLLRGSWPEDTTANSDDFACSDVVPFRFCP
ncbi:unnamed protein product [Fraxinus pennsylvanica]|uniref:U-box domain-containing protein n=1 Tax=Fraxinus pennsylvanica TaxID=56036 RepID=A0AAD2EBX1_9LAMI|nr:unnamed protein product [Fraxinus pennsylvanica]